VVRDRAPGLKRVGAQQEQCLPAAPWPSVRERLAVLPVVSVGDAVALPMKLLNPGAAILLTVATYASGSFNRIADRYMIRSCAQPRLVVTMRRLQDQGPVNFTVAPWLCEGPTVR